MGDKTKIEWTEATWNPVTGCTPVSDGCDNCYAKREAWGRLALRYLQQPTVEHDRPDDPFAVRIWPDRLEQPLHWRRPRMIFVCSMSDLFHKAIPPDFRARIWRVMGLANWHTFQVLTKRPGRAARYLPRSSLASHIWIGTSVETQRQDHRVRALVQIPAYVRFLSCEPLLGPIDLTIALGGAVQWVIVGGESGPNARPLELEWVRSMREQCQAAHVPFFVKQLGTAWARENGAQDAKGGNPSEWPKDLRIREYPIEWTTKS